MFYLFIFNSQEGKHSEEELPLAPLAEGQQRRDFSLEIERFHVSRSGKENWKTVTAEWRLLKERSSIYRSRLHLQEWRAHTTLPFSAAGIRARLPL